MSRSVRAWLGLAPGVRLLSLGVVLLGAASFAAVASIPSSSTTPTSTSNVDVGRDRERSSSSTTIEEESTTSTSRVPTTPTTTENSAVALAEFADLARCRGSQEWIVAFRAPRATERNAHPLFEAYRLVQQILATGADLDEVRPRVLAPNDCRIVEGSEPVVILGNHASSKAACDQARELGDQPPEIGDGWRVVHVTDLEDLAVGTNEEFGRGVSECGPNGFPPGTSNTTVTGEKEVGDR